MKKWIIFLLLNASAAVSCAQKINIDSLKQELALERTDTGKIKILRNIVLNYCWTNSDSALHYAQQEYRIIQNKGIPRFEALAMIDLSRSLSVSGNYQSAIKYGLQALRIAETINDDDLRSNCNNAISWSYMELKDYGEVIKYNRKNLEIESKLGNQRGMIAALDNLGISYNKLNESDSALVYLEPAYKMALDYKNWEIDMLGSILIGFGEAHFNLKNYEIALAYLNKGTEYSTYFDDQTDLYDAYYAIGNIYSEMIAPDSCLKYYNLAFQTAEKAMSPGNMLQAALKLAEKYKGLNKDSTLKYLEKSLSLKDSLYNQEKLRAIQAITYNENEYQNELENKKMLAKKEERENLISIAIALFVVALLVFYLVISHSVLANPKLIRFLGVVSLLIVFEFINLLLHPALSIFTHHSQVLMLLIMVCIAALLVPMHHRIEKWITNKLVKKNNAIRLAAAHKTIEQLEQKNPPIQKDN